MEITKTYRGFALIEFNDFYGEKCSLQKSSIATDDCIWLGIVDANPKIMASKAQSFGVETKETTGWVEYPVPDEVLMSTRMHLSREQVKVLLPHLQMFVDTGGMQPLPHHRPIMPMHKKHGLAAVLQKFLHITE